MRRRQLRLPLFAVLAAIGLLMLLAGLTIGASTASAATNEEQFDLYAGQSTPVGTVTVTQTGSDSISVQYTMDAGYCLTQTHVDAESSLADIPQTKHGSPKPGHFAQGESFSTCQSAAGPYTFTGLAPEQPVYLAAHAKVWSGTHTDSAWTAGDPFSDRDWSTYSTFQLQAEIELQGHFLNSVGHTVADANGLTYYYGTNSFTDPTKVYAEELWGDYPLYLPGTTVTVWLTAHNDSSLEQFDVKLAGNVLNLDGSNGAALIFPVGQSVTVASGTELTVPFEIPLPSSAKTLNRLHVEVYPAGEQAPVLASLDMIFCPPSA